MEYFVLFAVNFRAWGDGKISISKYGDRNWMLDRDLGFKLQAGWCKLMQIEVDVTIRKGAITYFVHRIRCQRKLLTRWDECWPTWLLTSVRFVAAMPFLSSLYYFSDNFFSMCFCAWRVSQINWPQFPFALAKTTQTKTRMLKMFPNGESKLYRAEEKLSN